MSRVLRQTTNDFSSAFSSLYVDLIAACQAQALPEAGEAGETPAEPSGPQAIGNPKYIQDYQMKISEVQPKVFDPKTQVHYKFAGKWAVRAKTEAELKRS